MSKDDEDSIRHGRALVSDAATIVGVEARLIENLSHTLRLCGGSLSAQAAILLAAADLYDATALLHSARAADAVFIDRANNEAARLREAAVAVTQAEQVVLPVLGSKVALQ